MSTPDYLGLYDIRELIDHEIYKYLTPIEIYAINPALFDRCLIFHINQRLIQIFRDRYPKFQDVLNEQKILISGSFILQCILGVRWESDIDIYTIESADKFNKWEHREDFIFEYMKPVINYKCDNYGYDTCKDYLNGLGAFYVEEYDVNNVETMEAPILDLNRYTGTHTIVTTHKIQVIGLSLVPSKDKRGAIDTMWTNIQKDFDFDVCANIYYIENKVQKVRVGNLDAIINKVIRLRQSNRYFDSSRIPKYQSRGFTIESGFDFKTIEDIRISKSSKVRVYYHNTPGGPFEDSLPLGIYALLFEPVCANNIVKKLNKKYKTYMIEYGRLIHPGEERRRGGRCLFIRIEDSTK